MIARVVLGGAGGIGLALGIALQAAWLAQPAVWWLRLLPVALTALTLARPSTGVLVFAGLAPLAGALEALSGWNAGRGVVIEQIAISVSIGVALRYVRDAGHTRLGAAAAVFGVVVVASAAVAQAPLVLRDLPGVSWNTAIASLLSAEYFARTPTWAPTFTAALVVEGLAVAVAVERVVRRYPGVVRPAVFLAVAGTTAVAALNLQRLVDAALASGDPLGVFGYLVLNVRVSRFYDVNAAGSIFVLALPVCVGLMARETATRVAVVVCTLLLLTGLWTSGSRTALLGFGLMLVTALLVAVVLLRGVWRGMAAAGLATVMVAGLALVAWYPAARNMEASQAFRIRVILAHVAMNMFRSAPVFGIGTARFHPESSAFGGNALITEVGATIANENSHNYFLQVLAENGAVGLAALLVVLGPTVFRSIRRGASLLHIGLVAGVVAYLFTWLAGHPQLVADAAILFWLFFGLLAGTTRLSESPRGGLVASVVVLAVVLTVPTRGLASLRGADLEHVGAGLSVWQRDADGTPYREGGRTFELYLPADGTVVELPLRSAVGQALRVRVSYADRTLAELEVPAEGWREATIAIGEGRRFVLVQCTVTGAAADGGVAGPLVHVGRAVSR